MKSSVLVQVLLLVALVINDGCKNQETEPCTFPHQLTVNSQCYAGNGLQFMAGGYGDKPGSFTWHIYALKDTSQLMGWTGKDEKLRMIASNSFVVADSLATNYQRLIVSVAANCGGLLKESSDYSFVKRKSSAGNCITWVVQNQ